MCHPFGMTSRLFEIINYLNAEFEHSIVDINIPY